MCVITDLRRNQMTYLHNYLRDFWNVIVNDNSTSSIVQFFDE